MQIAQVKDGVKLSIDGVVGDSTKEKFKSSIISTKDQAKKGNRMFPEPAI